MHPVDYLFEDIYRNYWGISPVKDASAPPRRTKPARLAARSLFKGDRR